MIVPENAYPTNKTHGLGWQCNRGSLEADAEGCVAVAVPPNGYLVPSGTMWSCERGFRRVGQACEQIAVPAHAYLTDAGYGSGSARERGYRASGSTCVEIDVPEERLSLDETAFAGLGCNRGFREAEGSCLTLVRPANAHLTHSRNDWECDTFFQCVGGASERPD